MNKVISTKVVSHILKMRWTDFAVRRLGKGPQVTHFMPSTSEKDALAIGDTFLSLYYLYGDVNYEDSWVTDIPKPDYLERNAKGVAVVVWIFRLSWIHQWYLSIFRHNMDVFVQMRYGRELETSSVCSVDAVRCHVLDDCLVKFHVIRRRPTWTIEVIYRACVA